MKYSIHIYFILICAAFNAPSIVNAQGTTENEIQADSTLPETDPLVQVAFRKVPQNELMGGVSVVNMTDIVEKSYFTYSLDNMQAFVGGWTGNSLWGMDDYLVLVDGVPRDADNVVPTEIDQITFLKGASAVVLYGSRAAKGVVYITTKRGTAEPLKVNVRANTGFHVSKSYPKYLGAAEYMTLYNEALSNDNLLTSDNAFSEEEIYNTALGVNPYRYPDVDLYSSDYLKKVFNLSDITAEFIGGNEKSRFYTNVGYIRQGDVFKFGEAKNNYIDRLNVRGNVDLNITDYIKAFVNANVTFYNASSAKATDSDPSADVTVLESYWSAASTMRPNRIAPLIPLSYIDPNDLASLDLIGSSSNIIEGKYFLGGSQTDTRNIIADYYAAGKAVWTSRQFQFDAGLDFDLSKKLKGLSFHTQYGIDYATSYTTSYDNLYAVYGKPVDGSEIWYDYNGEDVVANLEAYGNDRRPGVQNITGSTTRQTVAFTSYLNYITSLNETHNISAKLLATGFQQTRSQVYHRTGNANLGLQLNYNFKNKYYVDLGTALVHSAKLAEGKRNGLSSSVTLGWRLDQENFLSNSSAIDNLVLSVSGSVLQTDMDLSVNDIEAYITETNYTQANGAWWGWRDGASERSTNIQRGTNRDLGFVKRKEFSANVRTSLWDRLITADASFFVTTMEGLIIQPSTIYPSYFSTGYPNASFMPYVNFNNNQRRGIDISVNLNKRIGEVDFSLGVAGTYISTENTRVDENFEDSYRNRTGKAIDGIWGLESAGLFRDQADIDNSPTIKFGPESLPGDIKYIDQNNDGIINERDEIFLGRGGWNGGPLSAGINLTAKWRGFTFFALGTGNFGAYALKNSSYFWVYGDRKYSEVVRDRWTPETQETATYPRLTTQSGTNNFRNSDFWLFKTNRFNVARVQLTYDLPERMFETSFFNNVSVYVGGYNLLTLSKEREILEMNIGSAPQTRFYNIGVRAAF